MDGSEDALEESDPAVEVAAREELLRRATAKIERLEARSSGRGRSLDPPTSRISSAVGQRGQPPLERPRLDSGGGAEVERPTVQSRRAVECERGGRAIPGDDGVGGRALRGSVAPIPVRRQDFRVGVARQLEREREVAVASASSVRVEVCKDRLADSVVEAKGSIVSFREAPVVRTRCCARRAITSRTRSASSSPAAAAAADCASGRPATAVSSRMRRAPASSRPTRFQSTSSRRCPTGPATTVPAVANQLVDEERMPPCLLGDRAHTRAQLRVVCAGTEEAGNELLGVLGAESLQAKAAMLARGHGGGGTVAVAGAARARSEDEQESGLVRRPKHLAKQFETIGVRPLHVVDHDEKRSRAREADEELAERGDDALALRLRARDLEKTRGGPAERREHGKRLREEPESAREEALQGAFVLA